MAAINVTPLVDVMLVLLIVFLVTASLGQQGITVALPKADAAAVTPEATLTVTIDNAHRIFLDSVLVEEARLTAALKALLEDRSSKGVLLKADETVPYGDFVRVVSKIKAAGVDQLGMLTEPAKD